MIPEAENVNAADGPPHSTRTLTATVLTAYK
jgi:hypothetical protein